MTTVLDSSAVLAVLNREAGAEAVKERLADSLMSLVNTVEVGTKLVDRGMTAEAARDAIELLEITMVDFDQELAETAIELRDQTRAVGLSLADRACLALALREKATALTADRVWSNVDVGCNIEVIR
jgi:PIN domain nuclease of toxin-antitoxin system